MDVNTSDGEWVSITDKHGGRSQQFPSRHVTAGRGRGTSHCRQSCSFTSVCVDRDSVLIRILMTHWLDGIQRSESRSERAVTARAVLSIHTKTCSYKIFYKAGEKKRQSWGILLVNTAAIRLAIWTTHRGESKANVLISLPSKIT